MSVRRFFQDWGVPIFLTAATLLMLALWIEDQRVIAAKERIATDRASIAETKNRVISIEKRLQSNNVPDRLERIERSIGSAVVENQEAIKNLDARQRRVTAVIEQTLGIPKEVIEKDGPAP